MTIEDIKTKTRQAHLLMVRQMDQIEPTKPTEWLSHWDNEERIRVTMHQDVMKTIKADPKRADLALKTEVVAAHDGVADYVRYIVITPRSIEATF